MRAGYASQRSHHTVMSELALYVHRWRRQSGVRSYVLEISLQAPHSRESVAVTSEDTSQR